MKSIHSAMLFVDFVKPVRMSTYIIPFILLLIEMYYQRLNRSLALHMHASIHHGDLCSPSAMAV